MKKLFMYACLTVFAFDVAAPAFADETTAEETTIAPEGLKEGLKNGDQKSTATSRKSGKKRLKDGLKNGHKKSQTADE